MEDKSKGVIAAVISVVVIIAIVFFVLSVNGEI